MLFVLQRFHTVHDYNVALVNLWQTKLREEKEKRIGKTIKSINSRNLPN